jgi:signal transduction histidine kinase
VSGEERKIQQVILNLIVNAEHAMQNARVRRLTLRTCHRDDMIVLEVADTGAGMAPEVQQRMFEPFFTTKPEGVGTGLGLSVSYGIMQAHGGMLAATSAPGAGTTFRVTFPTARAAALPTGSPHE